jgi:hypothetical protein
MVNAWLPRPQGIPENRAAARLRRDRSNFRQMPMFRILRKFAAHFRQIRRAGTTTPSGASASFVSKAAQSCRGHDG